MRWITKLIYEQLVHVDEIKTTHKTCIKISKYQLRDIIVIVVTKTVYSQTKTKATKKQRDITDFQSRNGKITWKVCEYIRGYITQAL